MTKLVEPDQLAAFDRFEPFRDTAARWVRRVSEILRGQLDFVDNVRAAGPFDVTLSSSVDTVIQHDLGFVPQGYLVIAQSQAGSVIRGSAAWTQNSIALRGSATMNVRVLVI